MPYTPQMDLGGTEVVANSVRLGATKIAQGSVTTVPQIIVSQVSPPTVSAPKGTLALSTAGSSTSTRLYVNTNGTTGWAAITTAS